ncbi:MAG TPA: TetR/AcrR family transcriptional regulator [Candidatus Methylomirabilis sp.]|nr:TetR/AcrR family transcriptional regulator [Candidatus Methylomirabilis sp.]
MPPRAEARLPGKPARSRQVRVTGEERRRQIIEAAATLFSRKGFRGTTTWEIARAVGVSEAMLFKHFATKEELYAAIIEAKSHPRRLLNTAMEAVGRQDDAEVLRTLARGMIERTLADSTLMRLTYFSALEGHALSDMMFRSRVQELDDFLSQYIAKRVAAGAFRSVDPLQAAWNFIGMVAYHVQLLELFGQKRPAHLTTERAVEEMVALFLNGVRRT